MKTAHQAGNPGAGPDHMYSPVADDELITPIGNTKISSKRRAASYRLCGLFSLLILSFLLVHPASHYCAHKLRKGSPAGSESIEQRVKRILTETPLIGKCSTLTKFPNFLRFTNPTTQTAIMIFPSS